MSHINLKSHITNYWYCQSVRTVTISKITLDYVVMVWILKWHLNDQYIVGSDFIVTRIHCKRTVCVELLLCVRHGSYQEKKVVTMLGMLAAVIEMSSLIFMLAILLYWYIQRLLLVSYVFRPAVEDRYIRISQKEMLNSDKTIFICPDYWFISCMYRYV